MPTYNQGRYSIDPFEPEYWSSKKRNKWLAVERAAENEEEFRKLQREAAIKAQIEAELQDRIEDSKSRRAIKEEERRDREIRKGLFEAKKLQIEKATGESIVDPAMLQAIEIEVDRELALAKSKQALDAVTAARADVARRPFNEEQAVAAIEAEIAARKSAKAKEDLSSFKTTAFGYEDAARENLAKQRDFDIGGVRYDMIRKDPEKFMEPGVFSAQQRADAPIIEAIIKNREAEAQFNSLQSGGKTPPIADISDIAEARGLGSFVRGGAVRNPLRIQLAPPNQPAANPQVDPTLQDKIRRAIRGNEEADRSLY